MFLKRINIILSTIMRFITINLKILIIKSQIISFKLFKHKIISKILKQ